MNVRGNASLKAENNHDKMLERITQKKEMFMDLLT